MAFLARFEVFFVVWLIAMAYVLSVAWLASGLEGLRKQGRHLDAPHFFHGIESLRAVRWLLSGRFEKLGDDIVARRARIARLLFFVGGPLILLLIAASLIETTVLSD